MNFWINGISFTILEKSYYKYFYIQGADVHTYKTRQRNRRRQPTDRLDVTASLLQNIGPTLEENNKTLKILLQEHL